MIIQYRQIELKVVFLCRKNYNRTKNVMKHLRKEEP